MSPRAAVLPLLSPPARSALKGNAVPMWCRHRVLAAVAASSQERVDATLVVWERWVLWGRGK